MYIKNNYTNNFCVRLRLETTKLLIHYGADYNAKSRYGDDALQTACLKGAAHIFEFLTEEIAYPPDQLANAHELMGATFLDEHSDIQIALNHWRTGINIREHTGIYVSTKPSAFGLFCCPMIFNN